MYLKLKHTFLIYDLVLQFVTFRFFPLKQTNKTRSKQHHITNMSEAKKNKKIEIDFQTVKTTSRTPT